MGSVALRCGWDWIALKRRNGRPKIEAYCFHSRDSVSTLHERCRPCLDSLFPTRRAYCSDSRIPARKRLAVEAPPLPSRLRWRCRKGSCGIPSDGRFSQGERCRRDSCRGLAGKTRFRFGGVWGRRRRRRRGWRRSGQVRGRGWGQVHLWLPKQLPSFCQAKGARRQRHAILVASRWQEE